MEGEEEMRAAGSFSSVLSSAQYQERGALLLF